MSGTSPDPKVFLSYSYDGSDHADWVRELAAQLRAGGVDAILDQWDLTPGQDLAHFMEQGIAKADRVVLICSDLYVEKADAGSGGVGYEKMIVTKEIVANIASNKFIPVLRNNTRRSTPVCLGTRKYIDFNTDADHRERLEELLRAIHEAPRHPKPPIGPNPFASNPASSRPAVARGDVLADPWFAKHRATAMPKVKSFSRGTMEVAFGARDWVTNVDQKSLLEACERATVHTFGWPIGVVLHTDDGSPKPTNEGLVAQIESNGLFDGGRFDYWALRRNGDFYLAHNIFEDGRKPGELFFNTRMVRVAEALLYCRNLYSLMGCPSGTTVDVSVRHTGLKDRQLSTSNPNRMLPPFRRVSEEDEAEGSVSLNHAPSDDEVVRLTKALLDPLFVLFDFFKPDDVLYEEVVKAFIAGRTT